MGYKAKFSPRFFRSKCKPSPLPCLPWDSVGGVGQGQFCILHKSGIEFPGAGRSPGLAVWPGMLGRLAAWVERLGGGLIGCRWWAALLCCDFLCAPSLFSLLPSPPLSLSRSSAPWVQAVGLALVFGWALALHGRRRSRFPGLGRAGAPLLALRPLRLCWVLALPFVLWRLALPWFLLASAGR